MTQTALILGASGKIGSHAAEAFWNAGWTVRKYQRGTDMAAAAMGADVIINGLNPPNYANWAKNIPAITTQVIAAAKASGASVIIPGNIYNFGNQPGTLDENTPHLAQTRKGKIRIEMESAYRASGVQTIILRAGNFIDPNGNGDLMGFMAKDIAKGKLMGFGDANATQAYAYVPDWARAAAMLADRRANLPMFADIPFPGHAFKLTDLQSELGRALGKLPRLTQMPWWIMTALSPFWELAREMREMRYLYSMDHRISDTLFNDLLPDFRPTPLAEVMRSGLPADLNPNKMMRTSGKTVVTQ